MYDRSDDTWDELTRVGAEILIERARLRRVTTYTELNTVLARRTGQPAFDFSRDAERAAMGQLLFRIVEATWDPDRKLMISALVHYLDQNDAGPGFYTLAADKGLLPRTANRNARLEFWVRQVAALHELYATRR
ncbi:hypothetical protein [Geodermatophilus sp. URMC 63]